jgi:hypothetical protein
MKRFIVFALLLAACGRTESAEHYGFIARLGRDTVSAESVTRQGNTLTSDEVDRFPRVRQRHTEVTLRDDGGIQRLVTDIRTPSEPEKERERHVVAEVTGDSVHITKRDGTGTKRMDFATGGGIAMAHLPQMYSLYELYFAAARKRAAAKHLGTGDTVQLRQFYIDREFDRFPLHGAVVKLTANDRAEIQHDWLAGVGEATLDSAGRLLSYSGARTTYLVDVRRVADAPDVQTIGARFAAQEASTGGAKQLSVRDTARASIGSATFAVDYGRPLARGRVLLGDVVPYDQVWRTGANAATQFTTSAPITLAGLQLDKGTYTLWTIPRRDGTTLIVNKETGQWGTGYDASHDLARAPMTTEARKDTVEKFTISIAPTDATHGVLAMEWGTFRWTAPIVVR